MADLVALARRSGFSRFPVHNGDPDTVLGVVHIKQTFGIPVAERPTTELRGLVQQVPTVPESLDGDALLTSLRESGLQVAVVVDEYGGTAGIVTLEDLVEEIVGDVRDEHDRAEQAQVRPLSRDSWLVSGLLRDHEVADATGFRMPPAPTRRWPGWCWPSWAASRTSGRACDVEGWRLTVMRRDRRRLAELRLARPGLAGSPADPAEPAGRFAGPAAGPTPGPAPNGQRAGTRRPSRRIARRRARG